MTPALLATLLLLAASLACTKATLIPAPAPSPLATKLVTVSTPTPTPTAKLPELAISATPEPVTVSGNWNCRAAPSISAAVIVTLRDGAIVQPTGETRNGWSEVIYKEYAPCWIVGWQ